MSDDRLSGITIFVMVVEAGSFSAAAERNHVTRSAVAKSVGRLEARLGVRLFHRTTRQHALTDEGTRYYEHCRRLLVDLRDVESSLNDGPMGTEGKVRVSAPVLFGRRCVAPVLRSLVAAHPRFEVQAEFSDRVVDVLADGFDLAVRIGALADSTSLMTRKIGNQRMGLFAAPSYLAAHGQPKTVDDLSRHSAIMYGRSSHGGTWRVRDPDGVAHDFVPHGRERYDDLEVVADSAVQGGGLAWLPQWLCAPSAASGQLTLVMDSDRVSSLDIHLVWPRTNYLPRRVRLLIDTLAAQVPTAIA